MKIAFLKVPPMGEDVELLPPPQISGRESARTVR